MKRLALALVLAATPLAAQETPAPQGEGPGLMQQGAELFLRGLMAEMKPTLDDMQSALDQIGPQLDALKPQIQTLIGLIDDVKNYHAPEKLENGDILIRRKTPAELEQEKAAPQPEPPVQTDL